MELRALPVGGWQLQADHKILGAFPCYLTTNQLEESHITYSPHLKLGPQNFSTKAIREFRVFEIEPLLFLAWPFNKHFSAPDSDISVYLASPGILVHEPCLVTTTLFGILSVTLSQHHLLGFEIVQLEFHHLH